MIMLPRVSSNDKPICGLGRTLLIIITALIPVGITIIGFAEGANGTKAVAETRYTAAPHSSTDPNPAVDIHKRKKCQEHTVKSGFAKVEICKRIGYDCDGIWWTEWRTLITYGNLPEYEGTSVTHRRWVDDVLKYRWRNPTWRRYRHGRLDEANTLIVLPHPHIKVASNYVIRIRAPWSDPRGRITIHARPKGCR